MYISLSSERKKIKIRSKISKQSKYRLTVYKSNKHIYAQLFTSDGSKIVTSMSSLDKTFKNEVKKKNINFSSKIDKSILIGTLLAKKIINNGIYKVAFDRSGFKFHGRIKAVADSIIKNGVMC